MRLRVPRLTASGHVIELTVIVHSESNCPNSYAYAFDESSGTALWTCDAASAADYTITFCP